MPSIAPTRIRTKIRSKLRKKNSLARSTSRVWTTGTSGLDFFPGRARLPNWGTPSRRAIARLECVVSGEWYLAALLGVTDWTVEYHSPLPRSDPHLDGAVPEPLSEHRMRAPHVPPHGAHCEQVPDAD